MTKTKALLGFVVMVALLAVSASPAFAEYESTGSKTAGTGLAGKMTFTTGTLGITCEKTEGEWKIRKLEEKEPEAKLGGGLHILAKKWNNCKNSIFGGATVKECEFKLEQAKKGLTTGIEAVIVTGCEVKALSCTIAISATEALNAKPTITQTNSGSNLILKTEVTEISGVYKGCTLSEKEKTGKEIGEVLAEGVKSV
jgi:hypothetical protein